MSGRAVAPMIGILLAAGWIQAAEPDALPKELAPHFRTPEHFVGEQGDYASLLKFDDGGTVRTAADWKKRREEIRKTWHDLMGPWPPLLNKPTVEFGKKEAGEGYTIHTVKLEIAPERMTSGYLLIPDGKGPFPAVVVVFYEPETAIGKGKPGRDFARLLARKGIAALSIGSEPATYYPSKEKCRLQPLSYDAYIAANCYNALATLPQIDPKRIGVTGHSYGGKWALFAGALDDRFACVAVSDPGIVFDEKRSNVNYWEPWYLGFEPGKERKRGVLTPDNPRTGVYKKLMETGHDLHELHALIAPRPFLVSGGSEDHPERWKALNHTVAINELLGYRNRVGMTNRPMHDPTEESNAVLVRFFEHFLK
jgi:Prolyl oligopeptidase family